MATQPSFVHRRLRVIAQELRTSPDTAGRFQHEKQGCVAVALSPASGAAYRGPKLLEREGRDAEFSADPRSVEQAQLTDVFYAPSTRDASAALPRWATVPRGEKLMYEQPLPVATASVPEEQRGMHIARGSVISYTARPVGELDADLAKDRSLPVMVAAGAEVGPTILFIAGEHGNEYGEPTEE